MGGRTAARVLTTTGAVALSVISTIVVFGSASSVPNSQDLHPTALGFLGFITGIGASVLLVWRHQWPVLVCGLALVPPLLLTADAMAALIALAALGAARRDRLLWLATPLVYAATALALWRDAGWIEGSQVFGVFIPETGFERIVGALVLAAMMTVIPLTFGILRGTRADLRQRERQEAWLRDEVARQEERSRIAHEMHDVLGHRLSLLSLQAGALEVTAPAAGDAARTVRTTAKQSLDDLRQVIGVLRDGRDFQLDGPAPALTDLPELVMGTRQAGVPVNLTVMLDQAAAAPPQLATAVYRVVQESLTNIVRHAPGAPADVQVRGGPGVGVTLEIMNPVPSPGAVPPSPGSGTGLTGISERVNALGGRVNIGPTTNGTFVVQAWLPWVT